MTEITLLSLCCREDDDDDDGENKAAFATHRVCLSPRLTTKQPRLTKCGTIFAVRERFEAALSPCALGRAHDRGGVARSGTTNHPRFMWSKSGAITDRPLIFLFSRGGFFPYPPSPKRQRHWQLHFLACLLPLSRVGWSSPADPQASPRSSAVQGEGKGRLHAH